MKDGDDIGADGVLLAGVGVAAGVGDAELRLEVVLGDDTAANTTERGSGSLK